MKKLTFVLSVLLFFALNSPGQEGLMPFLPEVDSVQLELQRQMEYNQLIMGIQNTPLFTEKPSLPEIDFSKEFAKKYISPYSFFSVNNESMFFTGLAFPLFSPIFQSGKVLSQGAYQLNNRFVLGGYSYGINSIFSAPLPGNNMNNFDRYGASMFLQYKVSKNFKIETRINVTRDTPAGF